MMNSYVVVDSNIFLATVLPDDLRPQAKGLINWIEKHDMQISAPTLFRYEIVAVIRKQHKRDILTSDQAQVALNILLTESTKVQFFITEKLLRRGYEIASQFNFATAYDSQYLAVAEHLGCDFWTIDRRMVNTVSSSLAWVKWLGDFIN